MRSSRFSASLFLLLSIASFTSVHAQVAESADSRRFSINAGAMGSVFDPHDSNQSLYYAQRQLIAGGGTYVDMHFSRWIQLEGEARWNRFDGYGGESQDNYLIGPRVPVFHFGHRYEIYGKALIGLGKMTFPNHIGYGSFTALAFGGGIDYKLSRKLALRPIDVEYQDWPKWLNNKSLAPYGVNIGVAYRVF